MPDVQNTGIAIMTLALIVVQFTHIPIDEGLLRSETQQFFPVCIKIITESGFLFLNKIAVICRVWHNDSFIKQ
jgi:hypothetical protein